MQNKNKGGFNMKTTQQNEKVQAQNTINNGATFYKVFDIQGNLCKVIYNNNEYKGKLLNTSPTTHLHFNNYDILVPSIITLSTGEQVKTKTTNYNGVNNQAKFKQFLNILQNKSFTFDKSTQAKATTRNNTKTNMLDYINANEKLKNEYTNLNFEYEQAKAHFEIAKTHFDAFINECKQKATQQQAQNTITQLLQSGLITNEQLQAIAQKQGCAK